MSELEQVQFAATLAARAYAEYARATLDFQVVPQLAEVKQNKTGHWVVNNIVFSTSAEKVIAHFDEVQRHWHEEAKIWQMKRQRRADNK